MKVFCTAVFVFLQLISWAQAWEWVKKYPDAISGAQKEVVFLTDSNVYILAPYNNTIQLGSTTLTCTQSRFPCWYLTKADLRGNPLWAVNIEQDDRCDKERGHLFVDLWGNVYAGFASEGYPSGNDSIHIYKFNPSGQLSWEFGAGFSPLDAHGYITLRTIEVNSHGELYFGGNFSDRDNSNSLGINHTNVPLLGDWDGQFYIVQLDSNGAVMQTMVPNYSTKGCFLNNVKIDSNDDLVVAGFFYDTLMLKSAQYVSPILSYGPPVYSTFITKMNRSLQVIWQSQLNSNAYTSVQYNVDDIDIENNLYLSAQITGYVEVYYQGDTLYPPSYGKSYLKLDEAGRIDWMTSDSVCDNCSSLDNYYYTRATNTNFYALSDRWNNTLTFGGQFLDLTGFPRSIVFLVYDSLANPSTFVTLKSRKFDGSNDPILTGLVPYEVDDSGSIYMACVYKGTVYFEGVGAVSSDSTTFTTVLAKFNFNLPEPPPLGIIDTHSIFADVSLFPNPANNMLNIVSSDLQGRNVQITLMATDGRVLYYDSFYNVGAGLSIPLEGGWSGVYFVRIASDNFAAVKQVVISK